MMNLYSKMRPDFVFEDERGLLVQLIHHGFSQINVLFTKSNCKRGNHYHKVSKEAFYIVEGTVEVTFQKDYVEEKVLFKAGDFFLVEPLVNHSMYFHENCLMIQMYDVPIEKEGCEKDIYSVG